MLRQLAIAIVTLVGVAVAAVAWFFYSGAGCKNTVQQRLVSPDGEHEAVVFERDCGATTDYSTQLSVLERGEGLPNRPGNAYIYGHRVPLRIRWETPNVLRVAYPPGFRGLTERGAVAGVVMRYIEDATVLEP
jgi:hypothetical protein